MNGVVVLFFIETTPWICRSMVKRGRPPNNPGRIAFHRAVASKRVMLQALTPSIATNITIIARQPTPS